MESKAYTANWLPESYEFISVGPERIIDEGGNFVDGYRAIAHPKIYTLWRGRFIRGDGLTEDEALRKLKSKFVQL